MKMFNTVVIAYDNSPDCARAALALRGFLEQGFNLRVHLVHLLWKRHVIEFLAGERPAAQITLLIAHGHSDQSGGPHIHFHVMHQQDDDYESTQGWDELDFSVSADSLERLVKNGSGIFLASCCEVGQDARVADAFFGAGYEYFITTDISPNWNGFLFFTVGLFYYLLAEDLEQSCKISVPEAVKMASQVDTAWESGTKAYHCLPKPDIAAVSNPEIPAAS